MMISWFFKFYFFELGQVVAAYGLEAARDRAGAAAARQEADALRATAEQRRADLAVVGLYKLNPFDP
jgi:hypothetical protein